MRGNEWLEPVEGLGKMDASRSITPAGTPPDRPRDPAPASTTKRPADSFTLSEEASEEAAPVAGSSLAQDLASIKACLAVERGREASPTSSVGSEDVGKCEKLLNRDLQEANRVLASQAAGAPAPAAPTGMCPAGVFPGQPTSGPGCLSLASISATGAPPAPAHLPGGTNAPAELVSLTYHYADTLRQGTPLPPALDEQVLQCLSQGGVGGNSLRQILEISQG